ncbi:hypothetical protein D3C81_911450 [compost metagenome]
MQGLSLDQQLTCNHLLLVVMRARMAVGRVDHRAGPAIPLLERVLLKMPGIACLDRFGVHAGAVELGVRPFAPLAVW